MGLLSGLPVLQLGNILCGLWIWAAPIFGIWLYARLEGGDVEMTSGQGAILGVLAGVVGLIISFVVAGVVNVGIGGVSGQLFGEDSPIYNFFIWSAVFSTFSWILWCSFPLLSAGGGWIGVEFFGRSRRFRGLKRE